MVKFAASYAGVVIALSALFFAGLLPVQAQTSLADPTNVDVVSYPLLTNWPVVEIGTSDIIDSFPAAGQI